MLYVDGNRSYSAPLRQLQADGEIVVITDSCPDLDAELHAALTNRPNRAELVTGGELVTSLDNVPALLARS